MPKATFRKAASRYGDIEAALRAEIEAGRQPPGSCLPGELELCERFGASRFTVRQALAGLRELGMVEARPGLGTFVVAERPRTAYTQRLGSLEDLLQYPGTTVRVPLGAARVTADAALALRLGAEAREDWVHLRAMRRPAEGGPAISWLDAWLRPELAQGIDLDATAGPPLLLQVEERHGLHAAHAEVAVSVGRVDPAIAGPLGAEPGSPAMRILRRYRDGGGRLYLVTLSIHPEGRFSLAFAFERT